MVYILYPQNMYAPCLLNPEARAETVALLITATQIHVQLIMYN